MYSGYSMKWGNHLNYIAGTHPLLPQYAQIGMYRHMWLHQFFLIHMEVVSCVQYIHRPLVIVICQLSVDIMRRISLPLPILLAV